jgi:hypothetical protein
MDASNKSHTHLLKSLLLGSTIQNLLSTDNEFFKFKILIWKFGSEAWVLKKREEQRLEAAQMKILRHLFGITKLDKEKNKCIREKMGAQNIAIEIKQYQEKWLQHVQRMDTNGLPKQALQYKPRRRSNIGQPRKRWRDRFHFEGQGTGNMPNPL